MTDEFFKLSDHLVSAGRPTKPEARSVNMPIELGSTMIFDRLSTFEAAREARHQNGTIFYGRYGSPASFGLEDALSAMEDADGVTLTSSGVAAITATLMACVGSGDHLLVADNVYGNTRAFCDGMLVRQGVEVEYFDPMIGSSIPKLFRAETKAIMFEAPGTGTFEVPDIRGIAEAARASKVVTILDATWSTPIFCKPLQLGVDVVVASGSKYLSGHSDCMIGTIAAKGPLSETIRKTVFALGDKPGSQEVFLALRGLRTLEMRMCQADISGRRIATFLAEQPQVRRILHPAFESCPGHIYWARDFTGAAGLFGVVFEPCPDDAVRNFVEALSHFGIGVSWGGYESLALPVKPVRTAKPWDEPGQLVRFAIGFENEESLIADLKQALSLLDAK